MDIGIAIVVYNGYGRYLPRLMKSIKALTIQPKEVVLVLGKDHGVDMKEIPTSWKLVVEKEETNLGKLKNLAMVQLSTEWAMSMSVDDEFLPWAIEHFKKFQDKDVIVASYLFEGSRDGKDIHLCMHPRINTEVLLSQEYYMNGKNYMHGSSPFKRALWLQNHYHENDCYNTLFWIDCAVGGANFAHTEWPCLQYNKSKDGHSSVDQKERNRRFKIINDYREEKLK